MKSWLLSLTVFCSGFPLIHAQAPLDIIQQLAVIDHPAPGAPIFQAREATEAAIEKCSQANIRTEFDSEDSLLERASKAPCTFGGVTTFRGRGDALAGDILKYDPEHQTVYWSIPTSIGTNLRYGQMALPFSLIEEKKLSHEQVSDRTALTKTSFMFLPLYGEKDQAGTYDATNAFGAKTTVVALKGFRYSLAINMGKQFVSEYRVATVALPRDTAPDLLPNLDVKLYWITARPCGQCLTGGQAKISDPEGPTFSHPHDVEFTHDYVFAKFIAIRLIDRRDGKIYATYVGGGQTVMGQ